MTQLCWLGIRNLIMKYGGYALLGMHIFSSQSFWYFHCQSNNNVYNDVFLCNDAF